MSTETTPRARYWLEIAYCDIQGGRLRDAEAFELAGVPENGRGWNISGPNSRDLDFMYESAEDRAAAKSRFEQHGFTITNERDYPGAGVKQ